MGINLPLAQPFIEIDSNIPTGITMCECTPQYSDLENPERIYIQDVVPVKIARFRRTLETPSIVNKCEKFENICLYGFVSFILIFCFSGIVFLIYVNIRHNE